MRCRVEFDWAFVEGCVLCTAEALQRGVLGSLDHVGGPSSQCCADRPEIGGIHILTSLGAAWFPISCSFRLVCWMLFVAVGVSVVVAGRPYVTPLMANRNTFVKKVADPKKVLQADFAPTLCRKQATPSGFIALRMTGHRLSGTLIMAAAGKSLVRANETIGNFAPLVWKA